MSTPREDREAELRRLKPQEVRELYEETTGERLPPVAYTPSLIPELVERHVQDVEAANMLKGFFPAPEAISGLSPQDVGVRLLFFFEDLILKNQQRNAIKRDYIGGRYPVQQYPAHLQSSISKILLEGWDWLANQGMIVKENKRDSFVLTRRGKDYLTVVREKQGHSVMTAQQVRQEILKVMNRLQGTSPTYTNDTAIATEMNLSVEDVRGHLGVLEREGRIRLVKTSNGYSGSLDPTQRQLFLESIEAEAHSPQMQVMAFNFNDQSMLRTLTGFFPLDGSIAWQQFGRATPDECEGVRVQFNIAARFDRRQALQITLEKLQTHKVQFMERRGQVWRLDLDRLREAVPDLLAGLDWASGIALVEPESEFIPSQDATFTERTLVRFSVYKEDYILERQQSIFLSHKGADKPSVRRFFTALKAIGFDPWLDEDAMTAGTELERGILQGFKDSCAAVFFITPNFVDEGYLRTEVNYAMGEKRSKGDRFAIITIVFADKKGKKGTVPDLLKQYVWKEPGTELEALNEILRALPVEPGEPRWKL